MKNFKRTHILMIFSLAFAYNSVYGLAFMKSLYYQCMLHGIGLTHFHLGQLYSVFGVLSMVSYLFGTVFFNHFSSRKLVTTSLLTVSLLTLSLSLLPPYPIMIIIFGVVGFLLGATFYPAHLQILHQIATPRSQGAVFSLFYAFNGILGIIFATLGFVISGLSKSDSDSVRLLFLFFSVLSLLSAAACCFTLNTLPSESDHHTAIRPKTILQLVGNIKLWLVILIVFTNYIGFSSLNYLLLYYDNRCSVTPRLMNILTITRTYLIAVLAAPFAGKITDHFHSASRLMKHCFLLTSIMLTIMLSLNNTHIFLILIALLLSCLFVNMGKSMALITIDEAGIPPYLYSVAVSFVSFCAYSPDAFFYSACGYILDHHNEQGYALIFLFVICISFIGFFASSKLKNLSSTRNF